VHRVADAFARSYGQSFGARTLDLAHWLTVGDHLACGLFDASLDEMPLLGETVIAGERRRVRRDMHTVLTDRIRPRERLRRRPAVRRGAVRTSLAAHLAAVLEDVANAVATLRALGIAPWEGGFRIEYPIAGLAAGHHRRRPLHQRLQGAAWLRRTHPVLGVRCDLSSRIASASR
jgi:hypothetical protein